MMLNSPSGARLGRSVTPTAAVRVMTADKMDTRPTQPSHEIRSRVWIEEMTPTMTAPRMAQATVQVACSVMVLKATEMDRKPAPAVATTSIWVSAERTMNLVEDDDVPSRRNQAARAQ